MDEIERMLERLRGRMFERVGVARVPRVGRDTPRIELRGRIVDLGRIELRARIVLREGATAERVTQGW